MSLLRAIVVDENGSQVGEATDLPGKVILDNGDRRLFMLQFVDPYGDTIFNQLQIPAVLNDLEFLKRCVGAPEWKQIIERLEALCGLCLEKPHSYLKFIGD